MTSAQTRALIVGRGSIGMRHGAVLETLGVEAHFVSRRGAGNDFTTLDAAFSRERRWDLVIICSETVHHERDLMTLAKLGFEGSVLVEKPLFHEMAPLPAHSFSRLAVAYPLRFHPVMRALRNAIGGAPTLACNIYAGKWLPDWRADRDYRTIYSARAAEGGGVLRDLSHELDYADWLFGPWSRLAAIGGHMASTLEIDSDDVFQILATHRGCRTVCTEINYLDRRGRRCVIVNLDGRTLEADLTASTLTEDRAEPRIIPCERNAMMAAMLRAALYGEDAQDLCDVDTAMRVMRQITTAEAFAQTGIFHTNSYDSH